MNRSIRCDCPNITSNNEFVVELRQADISIFAIELSMILRGLVNKLSIVFESGDTLQLMMEEELSYSDKARIYQKRNTITVMLSVNHVEYICSFLLKTYRDQMAAVNHIHIEGKKDGMAYDLTLLFDNYAESLPPDIASKLMSD